MLGKYNRRTVRASSGAVAPGAIVSFFWQSNGTPAMVYADQDGNTPLGSSVQSDADGRIAVFVTPGLYRIVTTLDGTLIDEITHEPIVGPLSYADPNSYALRSELKLHDEDIQLVAKSLEELKLAGGPRLASGRVLSADEIGMLADTGATLKTSEYHDGTSVGGAEYQLRTRASYRTEIGDAAWVPDGYGDHYLFGATTYVAVLSSGHLDPDRYGMLNDGTDPAGNTARLWGLIIRLRTNPNPNVGQYIGGTSITAYASGEIRFGKGVYALQPDQLEITQDLGMVLRGKGSRRTNQAILAPTTLLFKGVSSGFGFKFVGNGARAAHFEDLDVCYENSDFTGDLIDSLTCPGLSTTRVRLGCYGGTGATRVQTARSLVRTTYDEFEHFADTIFDGAVDGWWSDDIRSLNSNTFGGFGTIFINCIFYDCSGAFIRHDGNRTRQGINIINTAFNPINVDCTRAVDLNNVDGLDWTGGICTPSTTKKASIEWMRIINCTGMIHAVNVADLAPSGRVGGNLSIYNNKFGGTDGLKVLSGIVSGHGNEFRTGTSGWSIEPTGGLTIDLGPDWFNSTLTNSYYVPADSGLLNGRITYSPESDNSVSKFTNPSMRLSLRSVDERITLVSSTSYSIANTQSGRTLSCTAAGNATWTLPPASPGLKLSITKQTGVELIIGCSPGNSILKGAGSSSPTVTSASTDLGGTVAFEALGTSAWRVISIVGAWTFP